MPHGLMTPALKARFGSGPMKKPGGHFSALFLIDQSLQRDPERHMRLVPQEALEKILTARASELGIEIRRGVTVEGFEQDDDGVTVQTSAGPLRAKYLVGCDGGRSRVRKLAGFEFPGTDPTITGYQAVVEFDAPEKLARVGSERRAASSRRSRGASSRRSSTARRRIGTRRSRRPRSKRRSSA